MKLPVETMVDMALDAARGMQALNEASASPIVRFDLKPQQPLMDEAGRVLVNDLNMAQFTDLNKNGVIARSRLIARSRWWVGGPRRASKARYDKPRPRWLGLLP